MPKGTKSFHKGQIFGRLTVIEDLPSVNGMSFVLAKCDCGVIKKYQAGNLRSKSTISCGCYGKVKDITHGRTGTKEWRAWQDMWNRCKGTAKSSIEYYKDRGISVELSWKEFENFYADMGPCPKDFSLERKYVNKGYSKNNCYWASQSTQNHNKRPWSKTGKKGVYLAPKGKYIASITFQGIKYHLGTFKSLNEAEIAYQKKEKELYGLNVKY